MPKVVKKRGGSIKLAVPITLVLCLSLVGAAAIGPSGADAAAVASAQTAKATAAAPATLQEASDLVLDLVRASPWAADYSGGVIDSEKSQFLIAGTSRPADEDWKKWEAAAGKFSLAWSKSRISEHDYYDRYSKFAELLAALEPRTIIELDAEMTTLSLIVDSRADSTVLAAVERTATEIYPEVSIHVEVAKFPASDRSVLFSRTNDTDPFVGGTQIARTSSSSPICTSGFRGIFPNGNRVRITAQHCNTGDPAPISWYSPGSGTRYLGNAVTGSGIRDVTYINEADGIKFNGHVYKGNLSNDGLRAPKTAAQNPVLGSEVYAGGGFSGESKQIVTSVNVSTPDGVGPGFQMSSNNSAYDVGHGDSGGPVYGIHSDGDYRPRGMIRGAGFYTVGGVVHWRPQADCEQGETNGRQCSKVSFAVYATSIENAWGLTIE